MPSALFERSKRIEHGYNYGFCVNYPEGETTGAQAVVFEFFATAVLMLIVCSAIDPRNANSMDSFAVKVAICITALVICIGPFTGASLNTARTFGPALINRMWRYHWVYWLGPISASFVTPFLYVVVFVPYDKSSSSVEDVSSH